MDEYKVIEIMDEYNIIIDYGFENGAKPKDRLRIQARGEEITDKVTGNSLGTLDVIKAEVYVKTVYEKFSICQGAQSVDLPVLNPILSPLANMVQRSTKEGFITVRKTPLPVDPSMLSNRKIPEKTLISVGDIAIRLPD